MITYLVDSAYRHGQIRLISTHHEQAAAFAAETIARITGIPGVAMATSGPGATNLITGIGSCFFDSSPSIFITGQVNRNEQKGSLSIRQLGFQETDIVSIVTPITKAAWRVQSVEEIPILLEKAFILSKSGRPGPVLIDIPMDIQRAEICAEVPSLLQISDDHDIEQEMVERLLTELSAAKRPLILVGGGVHSAQAADLFRIFVNRVRIPVVHSLMAVDLLSSSDPYRIGMIGSYRNRWANIAVSRSDFLLVVGSRLDIRQTGADVNAFKNDRTIYHVDCDNNEINNRVTGCCSIHTHLHAFFIKVLQMLGEYTFSEHSDWLMEIANLKQKCPDTAELKDIRGINPNQLMHQLSAASQSATTFVVDVGNHQMWAAQSLELGPSQRFITSGGMGAMGFALPAAIGASLACLGQPVVMIAGDGGFQINIQELQTVLQYRLPIKMVILNNQSYGMVRQFQQSYFEGRYPSTYWGYSAPDFAKIANAYGIASFTVNSESELVSGLQKMWANPTAPFLLQVMIDTFVNAYPKIAFGHPISEMEPLTMPSSEKCQITGEDFEL